MNFRKFLGSRGKEANRGKPAQPADESARPADGPSELDMMKAVWRINEKKPKREMPPPNVNTDIYGRTVKSTHRREEPKMRFEIRD
ncbi:MAG: hypothetical protein KJ626_05200 [Verrucomicrobia bacterium]|nr:hypothetical protein [Verrucomicrobiota bacterium]